MKGEEGWRIDVGVSYCEFTQNDCIILEMCK